MLSHVRLFCLELISLPALIYSLKDNFGVKALAYDLLTEIDYAAGIKTGFMSRLRLEYVGFYCAHSGRH